MRLLPLIRKETVTRIRKFYCRMNNRTVTGCPHRGGSHACPVRRDCQAHSVEIRPLTGPAAV